MKTTKKQIIFEIEISNLTSRASKIFNDNNWAGIYSLQEFRRFCRNIRKTKNIYDAQEMFLNLTRI